MNSQASEDGLRVAVTGAGGYLGKSLCRYLKDRGAAVFQLTSKPGRTDPAIPQAQFTFQGGVVKDFFTDNKINSLVHAAYDFTPRTRAAIWECNVKGSINLFAQAHAAHVERIIFISSMSAYDGCRSLYGQAKLEIEKALREMSGGCSIRPGLIYSTPIAESGGMVGSILQSLQRGVIPLIGKGDQKLYLSHENDLAGLIEGLLQNSLAMGDTPIISANPRPYALREIIQLLEQTTNAKSARLVPVPWRLAWAGVRSLEAAGVNTKFRSDSILSLVHQNPKPDFSTVPEGIVFRDFAAAIGARSE
jgi:nucleoside-diphosphate-sugar epimerase